MTRVVSVVQLVRTWVTGSVANMAVSGLIVVLVIALVAVAKPGASDQRDGASPPGGTARSSEPAPTSTAPVLDPQQAAFVDDLRAGAPHALTMTDTELATIGQSVCSALTEAWAGPSTTGALRTFYEANLDHPSDIDGADIADAAIAAAADNLTCLVRGTPAPERAAALRAALLVPEGTRWTFVCDHVALATLEEAWTSADTRCTPSYRGEEGFRATPAEAEAIAAYRTLAQAAAVSDDESIYRDLLEACSQRDAWLGTYFGVSDWVAAVAVERICPTAPHATLLRQISTGEAFGPGQWEVGTEIPAGRYRSRADVRDCYWERLTRTGDITDNGFVTAAVDGVVVTVRDGEVFHVDDGCEYWTREG